MQDHFNTIQVLQDVRAMERSERARTYGGTGTLYKEGVSCVQFMHANRDAQLLFAHETGMFDQEVEDKP